MDDSSGVSTAYSELTLDLSPVAVSETVAASAELPAQLALWMPAAVAERLAASALLFVLSPLLLCTGLIVFLLSRRPPLVAHARVGWNGKEFWVLKLRTMWGGGLVNKPSNGFLIERLVTVAAPEIKKAADPRVTSGFASFCRKYSIDELPQLWHVVRGEMSLVGPRPMTLDELAKYYGRAAQEVLRLKPGLTGLWQVRGRSRLSYRQRRRLDMFLVRNWSFRLYIALLLATIPRVLTGTDAW